MHDIERLNSDFGIEDRPYIDKVAGDARHRPSSGPVTFDTETDRIYLETTDEVLIDDPRSGRVIRIAKQGSHSTVVWNPWIDKSLRMGDIGEDGYLAEVPPVGRVLAGEIPRPANRRGLPQRRARGLRGTYAQKGRIRAVPRHERGPDGLGR